MTNLETLADNLVDIISQELLENASCVCDSSRGALCIDCGMCASTCASKTREVLGAGASRVTTRLGVERVPADIAKYIDHTLLRPDATPAEIEKLCLEARQYGFAAVCVNPPFVKRCAEFLRGTDVAVAAVVGFPLGSHTTATKVFETDQAIADGATEIDMVINIGELKAGNDRFVRDDIRAVVDLAHRCGAIVKVIIEAALLADEEKGRASLLAKQADADFVKTSTGFGPGGATVHDVQLMREAVGSSLGVKAAGGVRNYSQAQQMIAAGATRIGASAGVAIVKESLGEATGVASAAGKY